MHSNIMLIPLTQGKFAIVDDEDFEKISKYKWTYTENRKNGQQYAIACPTWKGKAFYMHRYILGAPSTLDIDHINGNGLDNRRKNLRMCTPSQNGANAKKRKFASSIYKGVSWNKARKKWMVQICFQRKHIWGGFFEKEIEAGKTYNSMASKLFGEFANLNNI